MAEWSIAAVLKTVEGQTSGGSNPSLSAEILQVFDLQDFVSNAERVSIEVGTNPELKFEVK
jgi:hypothetical protein